MKLLWLAVMVCGGDGLALAQIESGTVVVLYFAQDKIVVAADSRTTVEDGYIRGVKVTHKDDSCKLAALDGKLVIAMTGSTVMNSRIRGNVFSWDAWSVLREVYPSMRGSAQGADLARKLGAEWARRVERQARPYYQRKLPTGPRDTIITGIFAGSDAALGLFAYAVEIQAVARPDSLTEISAMEVRFTSKQCSPNPCAFGSGGEVVNEFLHGATVRARAERVEWERKQRRTPPKDWEAWRAIRLVELSGRYSSGEFLNTIGGPTDAVEIGGIFTAVRWLQRKANCPAN